MTSIFTILEVCDYMIVRTRSGINIKLNKLEDIRLPIEHATTLATPIVVL